MERQVLLSEPQEAAALYRGLSRQPSLSAACLGPEVTTQYGGLYRTVHTEWTQRDLDRMENIRFCRQYLVFHDGDSVVFAGPAGNSVETRGELLSRESPSGTMKAVLRKAGGAVSGEEKQFSTPNLPPSLKVGFLPPAGKEQSVSWVSLEEAEPIPDIHWGIRVLHPPPDQENVQYADLDFEAILLQPSNSPDKSQVPMVVMPHGGPHSSFVTAWMLFPAMLCKMGTTDIPDWCMVETGFPYSNDYLPDLNVLEEMLDKSPIKYIPQVKTPVLLMLGQEDRRVPFKQGLEYYHALKARNVPVRLLLYPKSTHALSEVEVESDSFMNTVLWLHTHLGS